MRAEASLPSAKPSDVAEVFVMMQTISTPGAISKVTSQLTAPTTSLVTSSEATAGWTLRELMQGIDKTSAWEYQIYSMMAEAIKTRSVQYPSIALRISVRGAQEAEDIYRIGLGRVSEFEEEYEFVFILFCVRTPFDPSEDDRETMLYHLFNLAWHFRRRFVERHRRIMEDLADQQKLMRRGNTEDFQNEVAHSQET